MTPEPLSPDQVDALLRPDPRTVRADLLVLRDALHRLSDAWERVAHAADELHRRAGMVRPQSPRDDAPRARPTPPRAD